MRPALTSLIVTCSAISLLLGSAACGGGAKVISKEEQAAARKAPVAPTGPDAYRDYTGEKVAPDTVFSLDSAGRAIEGVGVVVALEEVKTFGWTDEPQEDTDGTAIIRVMRGTESVRIRIAADQVKDVLGARISVIEAKIAYDTARYKYLPTARIKVTSTP